jgi:LPXTG-site transpeptidase (sortase) family protein
MKVNYNNIMNKLLQDKAVGPALLAAVSILLILFSFTMNAKRNNVGFKDLGAFKVVNEFIMKLTKSDNKNTKTEEKPSIFADKLEPIYTDPSLVSIENLKISADVVKVGVDEQGVMETPKNWVDVGWFENSAKPGEKGNFILNGHFDTNYGGPAVFWQLKNIQVGDKVSIIDEYGKTYTYEALESFYVDIDDPSRLDVLKSNESESTMTLITCGGVWVPGVSTYNKRLIVKAELVKL